MAIRPSFRIKDTSNQYIKVKEAVTGRYSEVFELEFSVKVPVDPSTGLPLSSCQYSELRVVKAIDASSPMIFKYLIEGTKLPEVVVTFYAYNPERGGEEALYTLTFEQVTFTKHSELVKDTYKTEGQQCPPVEEVCLVAELVTKTLVEGHVSQSHSYKNRALPAAAAGMGMAASAA